MSPENQTKAERTAMLNPLSLASSLASLRLSRPPSSHNRTEPNFTLDMATEAIPRFASIRGSGSTWPNVESASAARSTVCWKCDTSGHVAHDCLHSGAIKAPRVLSSSVILLLAPAIVIVDTRAELLLIRAPRLPPPPQPSSLRSQPE
jgi:hypothetical protein